MAIARSETQTSSFLIEIADGSYLVSSVTCDDMRFISVLAVLRPAFRFQSTQQRAAVVA